MSDLFFVYFCLHICIHYSLMAFMKCEGAFSNIVFQKIICHKSNIYDFCVFQYYFYGCVFLEKTRKIEKSAEKFSKKKIKRPLFLQTLEIPKKLLQIYCYQNFCSNALTVTLFKSYCSNSNFVKKLLKSYCSNLLLQ